MNGQMRRDSRRNECKSEHTHPAYPTQLKEGFVELEPVQILSDEDSDDSELELVQNLSDEDSDDSEDSGYPDLWAHRDSDSQEEVPEPITAEDTPLALITTTEAHPAAIREVNASNSRDPAMIKLKSDNRRRSRLVEKLKKKEEKTALENAKLKSDAALDDTFNSFAVLRVMDLEGGKLNYDSIALLRSHLKPSGRSTLEVRRYCLLKGRSKRPQNW
jgi:hypothetical protein